MNCIIPNELHKVFFIVAVVIPLLQSRTLGPFVVDDLWLHFKLDNFWIPFTCLTLVCNKRNFRELEELADPAGRGRWSRVGWNEMKGVDSSAKSVFSGICAGRHNAEKKDSSKSDSPARRHSKERKGQPYFHTLAMAWQTGVSLSCII